MKKTLALKKTLARPRAGRPPRLRAALGLAALLALAAVLALSLAPRAGSSGGPIPVQVANPSASPVPTQGADARQPFQTVVPALDSYSGQFVVPAGKALVIQTVSADVYDPNSRVVTLELTTSVGGARVYHQAGELAPDGQGDWFLPLTQAPLHADPGTTVGYDLIRSTPVPANEGYGAYIVVSGYLVSAP